MNNDTNAKASILDAFQFRHATKQFDSSKKISADDFDFILETARLSPSSIGLEPWKFLVVDNSDLKDKLKQMAPGAQGQLDSASHFVIILARNIKDVKYDSDYVKNHYTNVKNFPVELIDQMQQKYKAFQEVDMNLAESDRAFFDWSCKQCYIALANMMTAAAQMGIDSCPIEGFHYQKVTDLLDKEGLLEDGHLGVAVMVAFGYRVQDPLPKTRKSIEDIVHWVK
ncbi:NAD(P)H-dependent oxidoreductase [Amphibacillus cookii]|uniref:NAD(P)H-dependent oxidoreductase n=1 Tax=Amphibacillus cookii TaxID=767787 RepID=UPI001956E60D|nr:NAD(P)H-dependent oxidoreductase [Amphibacillus cookii]MBM7541957.1 nitroreductase [Amphibacillus cookii]